MRPRREPADPHAVLGVEPGASRAEVRRAYRRRALEVHPDIPGSGDDATGTMARLNHARDELLARARARPSHDRTTGDGPAGPGREPREPVKRPPGAAEHEPAWTDHWSAWNEPRRRE
jgi:DnaJ-class molecular chaperone